MGFVVIVCYSKHSVLDTLYLPSTVAAESWDEPIEIVVDNDGPSKDTREKLQKIRQSFSHWEVARFAPSFFTRKSFRPATA